MRLLAAGDSKSAARYIEANIVRFPDDAFSLYLMAEALDRNRILDQSRSFALRAVEAAMKLGSTRYDRDTRIGSAQVATSRWVTEVSMISD
jgi:hypothetical protein